MKLVPFCSNLFGFACYKACGVALFRLLHWAILILKNWCYRLPTCLECVVAAACYHLFLGNICCQAASSSGKEDEFAGEQTLSFIEAAAFHHCCCLVIWADSWWLICPCPCLLFRKTSICWRSKLVFCWGCYYLSSLFALKFFLDICVYLDQSFCCKRWHSLSKDLYCPLRQCYCKSFPFCKDMW